MVAPDGSGKTSKCNVSVAFLLFCRKPLVFAVLSHRETESERKEDGAALSVGVAAVEAAAWRRDSAGSKKGEACMQAQGSYSPSFLPFACLADVVEDKRDVKARCKSAQERALSAA